MGILIALEGLDGAGKRTLVEKVVRELRALGRTVATVDFPRYGRSIHADLASEALKGEHGDLAASANAMAVLFALDRAGAADDLRDLVAANDIVILDRYVASNAAYGAARTRQGADGDFAAWIAELEFERLGLPAPDLQLLLDVPVELAAQRARLRGESDATRALDAYERDGDLQARTGGVYRELADNSWQGTWWRVTANADPAELAGRMAELS
ncbi:dTMP kinase [Antrihabitans cavernicola]|uniref:Thymidylate kinase n=1 Tax=Antrihabitans cavernicola TaxID=2495913 RepID=A0A5A7SFM4_9NOCA|nr:dTMP kinase [Spelaeibacter cavernicola]KAA0023982.1 dTMP kinase [Spelaeibacter cavernicola]